MKKITALLLVISILCSGFSTTLAADYREQVLQLLADSLQAPPETIYLEGALVDLPYSGEQLWAGKYYIQGEEPAEKPAEDNPDTSISYDLSEGVVYLHIKTGELLNYEAAQLYFEAERKLQQAEFELLSRQSGKIDPYLYQKIIEAEAGAIFEVLIWLVYAETASMKTAMENIMQEYPEFAGGFFGEGSGRSPDYPLEPSGNIEPGSEGGGGTEAFPGEAEAAGEPAQRPALVDDLPASDDEYRILPYPMPEIMPLPKDDISEGPVIIDDTDWLRYEEMMGRLAEVQAQGYTEGLASLQKALENMGAAYEVLEGNAAVRSELTADQLISIKEAGYIEFIGENIIYCAMDDGMERSAATLDLAGENRQSAAPFWVQAAILLLLAGSGVCYFFHHKKRNAAADN